MDIRSSLGGGLAALGSSMGKLPISPRGGKKDKEEAKKEKEEAKKEKEEAKKSEKNKKQASSRDVKALGNSGGDAKEPLENSGGAPEIKTSGGETTETSLKVVPANTPNTETAVVPHVPNRLKYSFGLKGNNAPGKYYRTKVITLTPYVVIFNKFAMDFEYTQYVSSDGILAGVTGKGYKPEDRNDPEREKFAKPLPKGVQTPVHFLLDNNKHYISIRPTSGGWGWSPAMVVDTVANFEICMKKDGQSIKIRVRSMMQTGSSMWVITVEPSLEDFPEFLIVNESSTEVSVAQKGCEAAAYTVKPFVRVQHIWEEPTFSLVAVISHGKIKKEVELSAIKPKEEFVSQKLTIEVRPNGPTRECVIRDWQKGDGSSILPNPLGLLNKKEKEKPSSGSLLDSSQSKMSLDTSQSKLEVKGSSTEAKSPRRSHSSTTTDISDSKSPRKEKKESSSSKDKKESSSKDKKESSSSHKDKKEKESSSSHKDKKEKKEKKESQETAVQLTPAPTPTPDPLKLVASIAGFGISLIDNRPREVAYIRIENIRVELEENVNQMSLHLKMRNFQIDNQLYMTPFPIMFRKSNEKPEMKDREFLEVSMVMSHKYPSIVAMPYLGLLLMPVVIEIDEVFLMSLLGIVDDILQNVMAEDDEKPHPTSVAGAEAARKMLNPTRDDVLILAPVVEDDIQSKVLWFEAFQLNSMQFVISYLASSAHQPGQRDLSPEMAAIENALRGAGVLANMDMASINLNSLVLENVFNTGSIVINSIAMHYVQQVMTQLFKVLGSSAAIGNPANLVGSLGTGFYDFFAEPAAGAVSSPQDFGKGLATGTGSLVKNSVGGIMNSATKITGNVSSLAVALSGNDDWKRQRDALRARSKPKHAAEGLSMGAQGVGTGVKEGVKGLFYDPLKGAREGGALGLGKGLLTGVTGVILRPTVGIVDAVTTVGEGISATTKYFDEKAGNIRLPRQFPLDNHLEPFDAERADGQNIMCNICDGIFAEDNYLYHRYVHQKDGLMVFLTSTNLLFIEKQSGLSSSIMGGSGYNLTKQLPIAQILDLGMDKTKKTITVSYNRTANLFNLEAGEAKGVKADAIKCDGDKAMEDSYKVLETWLVHLHQTMLLETSLLEKVRKASPLVDKAFKN